MTLTKQQGFTLIEVLVAVTLIGIISIAVTNTLLTSILGSVKAESIATIRENGENALVTIERALRNGHTITACPGDSIEVDSYDENFDPIVVEIYEASSKIRIDSGGIGRDVTSDSVEVSDFEVNCATDQSLNYHRAIISFKLTSAKNANFEAKEDYQSWFNTAIVLRNKPE